ncbi:hypothetical protein [Hoeflea prorocentri]|uniref:Uncharacterized protein n=1 Tax=Hoeflea prorocentri TaxID=1922333 RepID=A0A9X3UNM4_9HYPH|nr:hypothetical protein [Hoeflea prorocentri]MCY6382371.1 hypothetical protein [Hoeflea prorocentri]MDA5400171.1 hypothetical protein [Hoeflea prorocentri]
MAADPRQERVRTLGRLALLQRQLQRLAETELADTNRQRAEVEEQIARLIEAMGGFSHVHRLFPHLYAKRLDKLKERGQALTGKARLQEQKARREKTRCERIGDHLDNVLEEASRQSDEDELLDLVEAASGRARPSDTRPQASRKLRGA